MLFLQSFYGANKKPAVAGSGLFDAIFEFKLWMALQFLHIMSRMYLQGVCPANLVRATIAGVIGINYFAIY